MATQQTQRLFLIILGLALILIGILGFLFQGMVSFTSTTTVKNTIYLILGGVMTVIGVWSTAKTRNMALWVSGVLFIIFALAGLSNISNYLAHTTLDAIICILISIVAFFVGRD